MSGFTTGVWQGDVLTTYTTHLKEAYIRRNGVVTSDQATMTAHFMRHGDWLTVSARIEDPVYLSEPYVVSHIWRLDATTSIPPTPPPCLPVVEVARLESDSAAPHFLPGKNPFTGEVTRLYNIPIEAVMGGADTMYPEYRKKLPNYVPPEKCVRYCCGWENRTFAESLDCVGRGFASPEEPTGRRESH